MTTTDFTTAIAVNATPAEAFKAITNPAAWWSEEIKGGTSKLNDEFDYHYEDAHRCKMRLIEVVPNKKVVWLVVNNYFSFTKDEHEWTGDKIIFDITEKGNKTEIHFTQEGLTAENECYDICRKGWTQYINQSLYSLITTGKGQPNAKGKPQTEAERKLSKNN